MESETAAKTKAFIMIALSLRRCGTMGIRYGENVSAAPYRARRPGRRLVRNVTFRESHSAARATSAGAGQVDDERRLPGRAGGQGPGRLHEHLCRMPCNRHLHRQGLRADVREATGRRLVRVPEHQDAEGRSRLTYAQGVRRAGRVSVED